MTAQTYMVSARGVNLEASTYTAPDGQVFVTQGFPGKVLLIEAGSEAAAIGAALTQLGDGWIIERADLSAAPDADDPNAPDPEDALPADYVVAPSLPGVSA